jgi:hypothetical protein
MAESGGGILPLIGLRGRTVSSISPGTKATPADPL